MSKIARFYVLPKEKSEELLAAAGPETRTVEKKGFLFTRKVEEQVDGFWDFLTAQASEQEAYSFSGAGFCALDLVLEQNGFTLFDLGGCSLADAISNIRATSTAVYDHKAATSALARLNAVTLSEADVKKALRGEYPAEEEGPMTAAVMGALDISKKWLATVGAEEIGLLLAG